MAKKKTGRRGGRAPGTWTLLTQDALKTFRKEGKLSRSRLADLLGVSSGSVMNWETGRSVPMTRTQEQLVALMEGGAPAVVPTASKRRVRTASRLKGSNGIRGGSHDTSLLVTGDILKGYLATSAGGELTHEQLVALATSLRAALS